MNILDKVRLDDGEFSLVNGGRGRGLLLGRVV